MTTEEALKLTDWTLEETLRAAVRYGQQKTSRCCGRRPAGGSRVLSELAASSAAEKRSHLALGRVRVGDVGTIRELGSVPGTGEFSANQRKLIRSGRRPDCSSGAWT